MVEIREIESVVRELAWIKPPETAITESTDLIDDLSFESLQMVSLIAGIEEKFGIEISEDDLDIEKLRKFKNLCDVIQKKTSHFS